MLSKEELQQIKNRVENTNSTPCSYDGCLGIKQHDIDFITHAREDISKLIKEVERLTELKHRLYRDVEMYRKGMELEQLNWICANKEVERLQSELDKAIEYADYQIKLNNSLMNELDIAYKEIKKLKNESSGIKGEE